MDLGTIIGIVGAFLMLVFSVFATGGEMSSYLDLPSVILVIIGSYFCMMASTSLKNAFGIFKIMSLTFKVPNFNESDTVRKLIAFSDKSRREGLLSLEDEIGELNNEFIKKGLRLAIDGIPGETIQELMDLEINKMQDRHNSSIALMYHWAGVAPSVGMLGTVIGLVAMMKNLDDKSSVGPNMALALITTLYGAILANFICTPIAVKLKASDARESASMEMVIEGVLSIQAGDNPRVLAMKLMSYLTPAERKVLEAELLKD